MNPLSFHDKQHLQRVLAQQQSIAAVFNRFIDSVSPQLRKWMDTGKSSVWVRNGGVENVIDRELVKLQAELMNNLSAFQMDAWKRSSLKNDQMINQFIEGMSINTLVKEGMFGKNMEAFRQLQNRVDNGMNLSDKVWNIADQTKKQLEFYLGSGVSTGQSAGNISRDVRQLLDHPDTRFRRIRNADGKLIPSKPMQDYHPGAGVYRSAKMNALRTAATETNTAYRKSDHERWNKLDFVLGFEIKRSGNNKGPCSMCDAMVGKYPKEFIFTGNHPFCICLAIAILMNQDDFAEYLLNDTVSQKQIIANIPDKAKAFVNSNQNIVANSYLFNDNKQWFIDNQKNKIQIDIPKDELKRQRNEIKEWTKNNLIGKTVLVNGINNRVEFTMTGIKEALNQPHKYLSEKNSAIKNIIEILKNGNHVLSRPEDKGNQMVLKYHYIKILINKEDSYAVIRELIDGKIQFYTIVEKLKKSD